MHQWFKVHDKKWIVLSELEAAIIFLTNTKIIRTKKKIKKTGSFFRHGIGWKVKFTWNDQNTNRFLENLKRKKTIILFMRKLRQIYSR